MANELELTLSPPWYSYHRKVQALFGSDPEVHVRDLQKTSDGEYTYMMLVEDRTKAAAIKKILQEKIDFGGTTVKVAILGPDEDCVSEAKTIGELYQQAFEGNPLFSKVVTFPVSILGITLNYCIFNKEIIQFWNDQLNDYYGNYNALPSKVAEEILLSKDVVGVEGRISFCIEQ